MTQSFTANLSFTKLFVTDFGKTVSFFSDVLGLTEAERFVGDEAGRVCDEILYSSEGGVALVAVAYHDGNVPSAVSDIGAGVSVNDLDAVVAKARAAGCYVEPVSASEEAGPASAIVHSPDGHTVIVTEDGSKGSGLVRSVRLVVSDIDRNIEFFQKVLGLQVQDRNEKAVVSGRAATEVLFDLNPPLSLVRFDATDAPQPTGATYVGLIVDDVEQAIERGQQLGSTLLRPIKPSGGGPVNVKSAIITGVEGHRIELAEVV